MTEVAVKDAIQAVVTEKVVRVNPNVAKRRAWKKFSDVANQPAGPIVGETYLGEELSIQWVLDDNIGVETDPSNKEHAGGAGRDLSVHCRHCDGSHLSCNCPYKNEIEKLSLMKQRVPTANDNQSTLEPELADMVLRSQRPGSYMPPSIKDSMNMDRRKQEDENSIRVNNLSENTTEDDLRDLFSKFGNIKRVFLARDKVTKAVRGFAYVTYEQKQEAANAIRGVDGFGFDHLILKVDWSNRGEKDKRK